MKNEVTFMTNSEKETMDFGRFLGGKSPRWSFHCINRRFGRRQDSFRPGTGEGNGYRGSGRKSYLYHYEYI